MEKIKKGYNFKIILLIIFALVVSKNTTYGIDISRGDLRNPLLTSSKKGIDRLSKVLTSFKKKDSGNEETWYEVDYTEDGIVYRFDKNPREVMNTATWKAFHAALLLAQDRMASNLNKEKSFRFPKDCPMIIYIASDRETFLSARESGRPSPPAWVGVYLTENRVYYLYEYIQKCVEGTEFGGEKVNIEYLIKEAAHEFGHAYIGSIIFNRNRQFINETYGGELPVWLHEGIQVNFHQLVREDDFIDLIVKKSKFPTLNEMRTAKSLFGIDSERIDHNVAYQTSGYFVRYLIDYLDRWLLEHNTFEIADESGHYVRPIDGLQMILMIMGRVLEEKKQGKSITFEAQLIKFTQEVGVVDVHEVEKQWREQIMQSKHIPLDFHLAVDLSFSI
jgi:hypothetical protein